MTLKIVILLLLLDTVWATDECESLSKDCGECMSNPACVWCSDIDYSSQQRRCSKVAQSSCKNSINVKNGAIEFTKDEPLGKSTLVRPQEIDMKLRPGIPQEFTFTVGQSAEYPVDLYFLFDLSFSMNVSRRTLADQSGKIIDSITDRTHDLRIGFGSFIDKNLSPFKSSNADFNCPANLAADYHCRQPYSFWNQIPLKDNFEDFGDNIKNVPLAGNVDNPEGSLDGLLQAMLCKKEVGWRNFSRKIILVATDRDYHIALDGKLAGLLHPHDGLCHLDPQGYYDRAENLDYPSVSHVNYVAQQGSYLIIFAIPSGYFNIYDALSEEISDSTVAVLEKDAKNIVDIINSEYNKFVGTVKVQAQNYPSDKMIVEISSDCVGGESVDDSTCTNIPLGAKVEFKASIRLRSCLSSPVEFELSPVGINQNLRVKVDSLCQCPCEMQGNPGFEADSSYCSGGQGDLACGKCNCHDGYNGNICQCDENNLYNSDNSDDPSANCKDKSSKDPNLVCSGRGQCKCGTCFCLPDNRGQVFGQFCECDDFSCRLGLDGKMCSGHGKCNCGKCDCDPRWTGDDCSCEASEDNCQGPYAKAVCSGHGQCKCNKCQCDTDTKGGVFTGQYCEIFPNDPNVPCTILAPDVECFVFGTGAPQDQCPSIQFSMEYVNSTDPVLNGKAVCKAMNGLNCYFSFTPIVKDDSSIHIYFHIVDGEKEDCPAGIVAPLTISLGVIILLAGLLALLAYICCIKIKDLQEYNAFLEQQKYKVAMNENPLHKSPIQRFENPMYNKEEKEKTS